MKKKDNDSKKIYHIILLGDNQVGKSSLIKRIVDKTQFDFNNKTDIPSTTKNCDFKKAIFYQNTEYNTTENPITIKFWDTVSGLNEIQKNEPFFKYIDLVILNISVDNKDCLSNLSSWVDAIYNGFTSHILICVVVNKIDIKDWAFEMEDLDNLLIDNKITEVFYVSSKENKEIKEMINSTILSLEEKYKSKNKHKNRISLKSSSSSMGVDESESKSKCC